MRKVIKISGKAIAALILFAIISSLAVSLLLDLPAVQNAVVQRAAAWASRRIGTTVSIDRVDIGLFNDVRIRGFYVEDFQHDTLLYAGRLHARIARLGIFGGGVSLYSAEASGVRFFLRETPDGVMNIKQVIDSISRREKKKKGNFRLDISSLSVDSLCLGIERLQHRNPEYGIDFGDIAICDAEAEISDFAIEGSTVTASVGSFSAREKSGFVLDGLSGQILVDRGLIRLADASLRTGRSSLDIPKLSLAGDDWSRFKYFIDSVAVEASLRSSRLATDDIAFFSPKLRPLHLTLSDLSADVQGMVSDFYADIVSARTGRSTSVSAGGSVKGLPDIRRAQFDLKVRTLKTDERDVALLAGTLTPKGLPAGLAKMLARAGAVGVSGTFRGTLSSFTSRAAVATGAGRADLNLRIRPAGEGSRNVMGNVSSHDFDLGRLLGSDAIGRTSLAAHVDGDIGGERSDAALNGKISLIEINGFQVDSIRFDGRIRHREFDGRIRGRNDALRFDFDGLAAMDGDVPRYDFCLDLANADLARLGINRRDSISALSAHIDAVGSGRTLDDMNGRIELRDARYRYNADTVTSDLILVEGRNSDRSKFIRLTSDIADASFISRTSYRDALDYFRRCLHSYIPSFFAGAAPRAADGERPADGTAGKNDTRPDSYSIFEVGIKNFNPVADAVSAGLQIADSTRLKLIFNPSDDRFSLTAASDYVERHRMLATKIRLDASNRDDSLTVYAASEDIYLGPLYASHPSIMCGAKDDRVLLSAGFSDTARRVSGLIGIRADIRRDSAAGRKIFLHVLPSHITRRDKSWRISARRLEIDSAKIVIDRFRMMNNQQELSLNGTASSSREDSVTLRLKNFDLGAFTQIADRMGYVVEGTTNGFATAKSALHGAEITARILMDSIEVNDMPSPALLLDSRWDFERSRARFFVSRQMKGDTLVRGYYNPSQMRYYARLDVDSLKTALLDPVLAGVVSGTEGTARAELVLSGEKRRASLRGKIDVRGLRTKVDYTQTVYSAPHAVIDIADNGFSARGVELFDSEGNRGTLDFDMSLQHLSNISYDLRIRPERMLVLNTSQKDNNLFYGKVYASGSASISGDRSGVRMNIVASTDDNSEFYMPLSGKSNISRADFVIFESADKPDTSNYLVRKRMMFERKQKQRGGGGGMDINLALEVGQTTDVQIIIDPAVGDVIKGRGEGMLNLHINPRSNIFEMSGDYTIERGDYRFTLANIISKPFTIKSGSTIIWTGEPLDALLDIDAVYRVKASLAPVTGDFANSRAVPVDCIIHIADRLTHPTVTFDIAVPSADSETQTSLANTLNTQESIARQFMYLLITNSFMSESGTSSSNMGATASAATGFELLAGQLSNILSGEDYNIQFNYRPKSDRTGTGDEFDFGFSKSLIDDRLIIEVEGNYIVDNRSATDARQMSNFMGEAYITWLIDRAGNLRLKGFTQNIDRFDENQGLQETGIGIYYKEDFDNLRDLRRRIKDRFTSRRRRERRAAAERAQSGAAQDAPAADSTERERQTKKLK